MVCCITKGNGTHISRIEQKRLNHRKKCREQRKMKLRTSWEGWNVMRLRNLSNMIGICYFSLRIISALCHIYRLSKLSGGYFFFCFPRCIHWMRNIPHMRPVQIGSVWIIATKAWATDSERAQKGVTKTSSTNNSGIVTLMGMWKIDEDAKIQMKQIRLTD